jgi:acyl-coenzyme A synthetase/AMP-(fatty) acid ligase
MASVNCVVPPHKWLREIEFVPALPRTAEGKLRRAALRPSAAAPTGDPPRSAAARWRR